MGYVAGEIVHGNHMYAETVGRFNHGEQVAQAA